MTIERRTLKYSNLVAATGTTVSKNKAFLLGNQYLTSNQCMKFVSEKVCAKKICNFVERYFEITIEYN